MLSLDGNLFRCRVRNEFGQRFSNPAALSIVPGYTWIPPNPFVDLPGSASHDLAGFGLYAANYNANISIGFTNTLVDPNFSCSVGTDNSDPSNYLLFSAFFAAAGVKDFSYNASIAGSFIPGPANNYVQLYSLDGSTLIDEDSTGDFGDFSTTFHLNVPAPGQYLIWGTCLRAGLGAASVLNLLVGYTLGVGDAIATTV